MACLVSVHPLVGRIRFPAVGESHLGGHHAVNEFEKFLRPPEAAGGEPDVPFAAIEHRGDLLKILFVHLVESVRFPAVNVKYRHDPATFPARNNNLAPAFA